MEKLTVVLFVVVASVSGFLIKVPTTPAQPPTASSGWVHLQKLILPLFENVCEESTDPTIIRLAKEFALDPSSGIYLKSDVIANMQNLLTGKGLLPKDEIFSEYNVDHLKELKIVFEVLYYAKDFDTFYKAASWARQNTNCGLFVDVMYFTILHRRDTARLTVPAPYEILPNYFVKKQFIYTASAVFSGLDVSSETVHGDGNSYIVDANYTSDFISGEDELKLAYFREDVGLNSYYFLQKLKKCSWIDTTNRHGEYLYHLIKQLAARYSLERYSNGLGDIEDIEWDSFTVYPYNPMLTYSTGDEFGHRATLLDLSGNADVEFLQSIESNIATVVTHMRDTGYNKTEIINHLMEILMTGDKSFEAVAQKLVGKVSTTSQPSVLEHYMTTLRDPVFWKLNEMIVNIVDKALKVLPTYTKGELYFPGLEIVNIDVKKVSTYFDYFEFDVTDALKTDTSTTFQVKISQPRLNHKPFSVKINVNSLVAQKGLVKLYLGPKTAPGDLVSSKNKFMLLDSFEYTFKKGSNIISRTSDQIESLSSDFPSIKTLRKNVADAEFGLDALSSKGIESYLGFPSRLLVPRGTEEGLPMQIFVFIAPFAKATLNEMYLLSGMEFNSAILAPGYPFDLDITDAQLFELPNALVKEVVVTHKGDKATNYEVINESKQYPQVGYQFSTGQDYAAKRKEPFDYKTKKGQYGRKSDYNTRKTDYSQYKINKNIRTTTDTLDIITDNIVNAIESTNEYDIIPVFDSDKDVNGQNYVNDQKYTKDNKDQIPSHIFDSKNEEMSSQQNNVIPKESNNDMNKQNAIDIESVKKDKVPTYNKLLKNVDKTERDQIVIKNYDLIQRDYVTPEQPSKKVKDVNNKRPKYDPIKYKTPSVFDFIVHPKYYDDYGGDISVVYE